MKKKDSTFKIESLFDKQGQYVAHCSKRTGDILWHSSDGEQEEEDAESEEDTKTNYINPKQQSLF